jgi:hypothetical protein
MLWLTPPFLVFSSCRPLPMAQAFIYDLHIAPLKPDCTPDDKMIMWMLMSTRQDLHLTWVVKHDGVWYSSHSEKFTFLRNKRCGRQTKNPTPHPFGLESDTMAQQAPTYTYTSRYQTCWNIDVISKCSMLYCALISSFELIQDNNTLLLAI